MTTYSVFLNSIKSFQLKLKNKFNKWCLFIVWKIFKYEDNKVTSCFSLLEFNVGFYDFVYLVIIHVTELCYIDNYNLPLLLC